MSTFMTDDFLLRTETARRLYHNHADKMSIIDFHNHLSPKDIYENRTYDNLTDLWLGGDHYKWRAMRANGIPESTITGNAAPLEKFHAWADTVQNCIGNPLYHWTHLELARYFGITEPLTPETADSVYSSCSQKLQTPNYSVQDLLLMQNVEVLCTTDDPADDLQWHKKLKASTFPVKVLPTFRPDQAIAIQNEGYINYLHLLEQTCESTISSACDLLEVLQKRIQFFIEQGCRVTDHSLEGKFYIPASYEQVNAIFKKRMEGVLPSETETAIFGGWLLSELGKTYARHHLVMQLHIGALRGCSSRMLQKLGANTGFDSMNDFQYAPMLSQLLDAMDLENLLPRTILYCLNPNDTEMLAAMAGNFQTNEDNIRGKMQLGSAWWLCDHKKGMERQLNALSDVGLLSTFVGMLTDSRSFLSFPRHEYFRRILCNQIGTLVENGEYPKDYNYLGTLIENICCNNAKTYFDL